MLVSCKSARHLTFRGQRHIFPGICFQYQRPSSSLRMTPSEPPPDQPKKRPINLLRGWPSPHVLPAETLKAAASKVLSDPDIFVPGLLEFLGREGLSHLSPNMFSHTGLLSIRSPVWT